jgi:hypothetical protein
VPAHIHAAAQSAVNRSRNCQKANPVGTFPAENWV